MNGDEVIQVYSSMPDSYHPRAIKSLVGFYRLNIQKAKEVTANIIIPVANLRIYDPSVQDYIIERGKYFLNIGASSEDIHFMKEIEVR
jgi:beta-glucosidase